MIDIPSSSHLIMLVVTPKFLFTVICWILSVASFLMISFTANQQNPHMSILCLYFSNKIYFCNTHSDWLQLLLRASSWNHRVTTEIWLILGWRGEVGRNLRLVKIWKHYHQLYQKYQITKRYDRQLL